MSDRELISLLSQRLIAALGNNTPQVSLSALIRAVAVELMVARNYTVEMFLAEVRALTERLRGDEMRWS